MLCSSLKKKFLYYPLTTSCMDPTPHPRVKICCISSVKEAWCAIYHGASALGLVSDMPSGPGVIPENRIAHITRIVPPPVATVLLTSNQDPHTIIDQQHHTGVNTIQLCDRLEPHAYTILRHSLPGISLIQVIHVTGEEAIDEACRVCTSVHALLLDSGNPSLPIKELGGTGRTHDWKISRNIRESVDIPVFLAGGLNPHNVHTAIKTVAPFGVDVCSGVRTSGTLDPEKVRQFMNSIP
jgi:phosphoribosylanthranilate isomerase